MEISEDKKNINQKEKASPRRGHGAHRGGDRDNRSKNTFFKGKRTHRKDSRSEFAQKVIDIRRVTRVVAGGRRFTFSVALVLGDKNGSVGLGVGKALDTALAIEKAARNAKKNMVKVKRTKSFSIPHEVRAKFCSSRVFIIPAPGRGLVAGSSVRNILDFAGITDVSAKILSGSKNKINNAKAAVKALRELN